jgi:hypothetical protein
VYAEEDTLWTTVHLTAYGTENDLPQIEQEVIAPTYGDMNLIGTMDELLQLEAKGEST